MKSIWVLVIVLAFVAGSFVTGAAVFADDDDELSSLLCPVGQAMTGILFEDDDGILDVICDTVGSSGSEMPISLGLGQISVGERDCIFNVGTEIRINAAPVLLSDGTIRIPSITGGFTSPDPVFGSLPAGVWHDIQGQYDFTDRPDNCFSTNREGFVAEQLRGCAAAVNGDVFCMNLSIFDGVPDGFTWTFQGNALP